MMIYYLATELTNILTEEIKSVDENFKIFFLKHIFRRTTSEYTIFKKTTNIFTPIQ